jgi:rhodanese-related sulfurtransferase
MGNSYSIANHDDVKDTITRRGLLIHIMDTKQQILIQSTIHADIEEESINNAINKNDFDKQIIIYGKNTHAIEALVKKQKQLASLGFKNVKIYIGGLFEWALLQDIYGTKEFPISGIKGPVDPMQYS